MASTNVRPRPSGGFGSVGSSLVGCCAMNCAETTFRRCPLIVTLNASGPIRPIGLPSVSTTWTSTAITSTLLRKTVCADTAAAQTATRTARQHGRRPGRSAASRRGHQFKNPGYWHPDSRGPSVKSQKYVNERRIAGHYPRSIEPRELVHGGLPYSARIPDYPGSWITA